MSRAAQTLRQARALARQGAPVQALVQEVLDAWAGASDDPMRADTAHLLASYYRDTGDWAESLRFARAAVEAEQRAGRKALLGNHWMFLATLLHDLGSLDDAMRCAQEGLSCYIDTYGLIHSEVIYIQQFIKKLERLER